LNNLIYFYLIVWWKRCVKLWNLWNFYVLMPFSILDPLEWTEWLIFTLWNTWSLSELRKQPSRRLFLPLRRTELVPVGGHGEQIGWKFKPFPTRLFKILAWVILVNLKKAQRVIFLWNFEHTAVCHQ